MPFTTPIPKRPVAPPVETVWTDLATGKLTYEAERYIRALDEYHKAMNTWLAALAASVP